MHINKTTTFIVLWVGGCCAGICATLFTVLMPDVLLDIGADSSVGPLGSLVISTFLFGWIAGGFVLGYVADRFGRVPACIASIALYALFTSLSALAQGPISFLLCRFFTGMGVGGEMLSISILLAEHFPKKTRALAVGALITSYQVGVFAAGALAATADGWRTAFALGGLSFLLAIGAWFLLQESPQWQQTRLAHSPGEAPSKISKSSLAIGATIFGSILVAYWASVSWVPTWLQGLSASGDVKQTAVMIHGAFAVVGCSIAGFLVNRWGRIPVMACVLVSSFVVSLSLFLTNSSFSQWIYVEYGVLGMLVGLAQAAMYIYLPELFLPAVRGRAVGFCLNVGRIVTGIAVLFVSMLVTLLGGYAIALACFAGFYLLGLIALMFAPETAPAVLSQQGVPMPSKGD